MNKSFEKFKNKFLIYAIVKSLITGIALGLLAVGSVLLALKLLGTEISVLYYVLIGVGVAVIGGGVTFVILRPTDVKIAKRLDAEYGLNEKVQTMVQFSGHEGELIELQRQDTSAKIEALPPLKIRFSQIWQYIAASLLAISIALTGILLPANAAEAETPVDPGVNGGKPAEVIPDADAWSYSMVMQVAMAELLQNIQDSALQTAEKNGMYNAVYGLDQSLRQVEKRSAMETTVLATVLEIDNLVKNANTYDDLYGALGVELTKEDEEPEKEIISAAMLAGATAFLPYLNSLTSELYDYVEGRYYALGDDITSELGKLNVRTTVEANWNVTKEGNVCSAEYAGVSLEDYNAKIIAALENAKEAGVSENDALYLVVNNLKAGLAAVIAKLPRNYDTATILNDIISVHEDYIQALIVNLKPQSFNCIMDIFVRYRIASILGVGASRLPEVDLGGTISIGGGGSDDSSNGGDPSGGGFGSGDPKYGSDDLIYNPLTGEYVPYGDLLKDYEAKMAEQADGLPLELRVYMEEYFKLLYGGIKDETEENSN